MHVAGWFPLAVKSLGLIAAVGPALCVKDRRRICQVFVSYTTLKIYISFRSYPLYPDCTASLIGVV